MRKKKKALLQLHIKMVESPNKNFKVLGKKGHLLATQNKPMRNQAKAGNSHL